jgi:NTP pyrophosphatase (non-canonical NTP hydrolase)
VLLAEEASEVIHAVTKILRHGWESTHPSCDGFVNRTQLAKELGDLRAIHALFLQCGDLKNTDYVKFAVNKLQRVQKYLHEPENIALAQTCLDIHTGHG